MTLRRRKKDGGFIVSSPSHVKEALQQLREIDMCIAQWQERLEQTEEASAIAVLTETGTALKKAVDDFVIEADSYEDDSFKITRVQQYRRRWNVTKLEAIVPKGIFKNLVKMEVDPSKIDEYVRKGKLDPKKISKAYEETPNAPYVKWTEKADTGRAEAEAEALAGQLA